MHAELTKAELQVFNCIVKGMSNKQASVALGLSIKGVKWQLTRIYKKFAVKTRAELIAKYVFNERASRSPFLSLNNTISFEFDSGKLVANKPSIDTIKRSI
jgi:DNA-binding CsgD family transcriptional regulator